MLLYWKLNLREVNSLTFRPQQVEGSGSHMGLAYVGMAVLIPAPAVLTVGSSSLCCRDGTN